MASTDTPRRFPARRIGKAVRSLTRRFRGVIYALAGALAVVLWYSATSRGAPPAVGVQPAIPQRIARVDANETAALEPKLPIAAPPAQDQLTQDQPPTVQGEHPKDDLDAAAAPAIDAGPEERPPVADGAADPDREKWRAHKMSVVVLFHNEYDSLRTALRSWVDNGLIAQVDEVLFFVNGGDSESSFVSNLPEVKTGIPDSKRRIFIQRENLKLGLAINKMVSMATHEFVLLLEKDWALIEDAKKTESRLLDSKVIVGTGIAHLIRHRHRHNPGVPLHALIMHQGRESSIMRGQRNLMCYVHHWQKDPTLVYPGKGRMWRCGGQKKHMEEKDVYCSVSEFCQWTNNPCVFQKEWFLREVGDRFLVEYKKEHAQYGDTSPFLDFEYYTNWRSYAWTEKNFTVAVGEGLFSHAESEHKQFNTFWYAHYRLETDFEELRNEYLRNETMLKRKGGHHYDPDGPPPPPMLHRYPIEFARKFHWNETFMHDLAKQREEIGAVYDDYFKNFRVSEEEWKASGKNSANVGKTVPWRHYITKMHSTVQKGELMVPPIQPFEMNITLVTTLLDIGRDKLDADDSYKFRREFKVYLDKMGVWLNHEYPKIVYTTKEIAQEVMKSASEKARASTKFVYTTREELATRWIGSDNYNKIQEIRQSKEWRTRASWLENSPQAKLEDYNPLVMSKMFMMRDAARTNPWNTTHFLFLDAKHNCMIPDVMNTKNDHILRAHMFGKFLLTYFDYKPTDEVHGFAYREFNDYLNLQDRDNRHTVMVGRGGIFGGSQYVLEYMTAMYDVALTATLRDGLMGTEENIFGILMKQVPQYIDPFSNNWACFSQIPKDHKCTNRKVQGYNCEIFRWMQENK